MPDRRHRCSAQTARIAGPRGRFALTLAALCGAAMLVPAVAVWFPSTTSGAAPVQHLSRHGVARVPLAAQGAISAALGREQPGHRLVGLRARNSMQRFAAAFSRDGATIDSGSAHVRLRLLRYGRDGAMRPASSVAPRVSANRVDYA